MRVRAWEIARSAIDTPIRIRDIEALFRRLENTGAAARREEGAAPRDRTPRPVARSKLFEFARIQNSKGQRARVFRFRDIDRNPRFFVF